MNIPWNLSTGNDGKRDDLMPPPELPDIGERSPEDAMEALLIHQRKAWQHGHRITTAEYLRAYPAVAKHPEFAADLLYQEFCLRGDRDTEIDEYCRRFPQFASHLRALYEAGRLVEACLVETPSANLGDYELIKEVGRGAMGVVYVARQKSLARLVALKLMSAGRLSSDDEIRRFLSGAEAAAKLDHPGIVPVIDSGCHQGWWFIAMALVEGPSLADKLAEAPFTPHEASKLTAELADAIDYAHQQGVIHRDLKPANVLLCGDGSPRVTDFGLSKQLANGNALTATGQVLGTPSYMSPEQAAGRPNQVGQASDVYALGAILYELLSGRPPFRAPTIPETLRQVIDQEPVSVRQLNPNVPRNLETICDKCLAKSPAARYATAAELAEDLRRHLRGEAISVRPIGCWGKSLRWLRRNPMPFAAAALGLCALIATSIALPLAFYNGRLQRSLYISRVRMIHDDYWDQLFVKDRADQLLQECPEHLRSWEWHYLNRLRHAAAGRLPSHPRLQACQGWVFKTALSTDGRWLATAGGENDQHGDFAELLLWDVQSKRVLRRLQNGHRTLATCVAFSSDNTWLASGGKDARVFVWNPITGEKVRGLDAGRPVTCLAFSADQRWLVIGTNANVLICDTADWTTHLLLNQPATGVAVSCTGQLMIATPGETTSQILILGYTNEAWETLNSLDFHHFQVQCLAASPNGDWLAAGSADGRILVFDAHSWTVKHELAAHDGIVWNMTFSSDNRLLASASWDWTTKIHDVASGQLVRCFQGHEDWVRDVAFVQNDRHLITASDDRWLRGWDATRNLESSTVVGLGHPDTLSFSADWSFLVTRSANRLNIVDVEQRGIVGHVTLDPHAEPTKLFSQGNLLALGLPPDKVQIWQLSNSALHLLTTITSQHDVMSVALDVSHHRIALGSKAGTVTVHDLRTGAVAFRSTAHKDSVRSLAFSQDGKLLAAGDDSGTVSVLDIASGYILQQSPIHRGAVSCVAFDQRQKRIATASYGREIIIRYLSDPGQQLRLEGHTREVESIAFNPDGKRLVSASKDRTVRIWDSQSGEEMLRFRLENEASSVRFSPDGHKIAAALSWEKARIWDATPIP